MVWVVVLALAAGVRLASAGGLRKEHVEEFNLLTHRGVLL